MRNSTYFGDSGLGLTKPVIDPAPIRTIREMGRTNLLSSYLVDLTVVAANAALSSGDNNLSSVPVPFGQPVVEFQTEFDLPTMDTDVRIEVLDEISEDSGASWKPFGGFVREPGPWLDRDGLPLTKCGIALALASAAGEPVSAADGSLKRSTVKLTKPVTARLNYLFRPKK